jgi:hypothetical protein
MSDEEFLARWSRRKREAKAVGDAPPSMQPTEVQNQGSPPPPSAAENPPDTEVDLSNLPPIDSITAATDVTAFLRQGIPPELSRAALRRAWAADPAIRDFVGLAENAWDFNDPHAMPGFGPLDCSEEQLAALVDRIVGGVRQVADTLATAATEQKTASQSADSEHNPLSEPCSEAISDLGNPVEISADESPAVPAAVQPETSQRAGSGQSLLRRRTHGSALPH